MLTLQSYEILTEAGLRFKSDRNISIKREEYPLSCLKNIIAVDSSGPKNDGDAIVKMKSLISESLIEAFTEENDWQIKRKIACAIGMLPPQGGFLNKRKNFLEAFC